MGRLTAAERWYGRLLALYPAGYRQRFEAELRQTFRDLYRERPTHPARFWLGLTTDLVTSAAGEHLALIRITNMKLHLSNSASQRTLVWGVGLMAPAGLFFVLAVLGVFRRANPPQLPASLPLLPILVALLPAVALAINLLALTGKASRRDVPVFSLLFFQRYFWTLAIIAISALWLVFLFGHDTVGCATQFLPHLQWQQFRQCAATH